MNRRSLSSEALNASNSSPSVRTYDNPSSKSKLCDGWAIICFILGCINVFNALWMLLAPEHWYYNLPAGVPEYGPLNYHFVRDIGCTFLTLGIGLIYGGLNHSYRLPLFTMNTGFYILHMFVHVHEVVSGRVRLSMFWMDLPLVYIPALITFILNIIMIKQLKNKDMVQRIRK